MRAAFAYHPLRQLSEAAILASFRAVTRMPCALSGANAPGHRRRKYVPFKKLNQAPHPPLSSAPVDFCIEIGAPITYDLLPRNPRSKTSRRNGVGHTTMRRQ